MSGNQQEAPFREQGVEEDVESARLERKGDPDAGAVIPLSDRLDSEDVVLRLAGVHGLMDCGGLPPVSQRIRVRVPSMTSTWAGWSSRSLGPGERRVAEERRPLVDGPVQGDDGRAILVPPSDNS